MKKRTKAELRKLVNAGAAARLELDAILDIEKTKANAALVGKCFKYRNCYSCPQTDADYWWLYRKVISVEGDWVKEFRFQTDTNGRVEFETNTTHVGNLSNEIPESEFNTAFLSALESATHMRALAALGKSGSEQ